MTDSPKDQTLLPRAGAHNVRRVLVVDDDVGMRHSLERLLRPAGFDVRSVEGETEALSVLGTAAFDAIIMDIQNSGTPGLDIFERIHRRHPKLPVVLITAYGTAELAIQSMQMGAYDYILKPFDVAALMQVITRAAEVGRLSRTRVAIETPPQVDDSEDLIVGLNLQMQEVYKRIGQVAASEVPILILGETGTGKELVARAIYQHSQRAEFPFVAINCAAIPEGLLESEMFGHERGAFTDAQVRRIGTLERANKGTVMLDEIGDMSPLTQAKILRFLQDGTFQRVGGSEEIAVDVRIIAATHRDLESDVREGRFREDLYYRLEVVTITLPPLRQRKDDLPRLVDYFTKRFCNESGLERAYVSVKAMARLIDHDWPGNIRELQNCLKDAILSCRGEIGASDLNLPGSDVAPTTAAAVVGPFSGDDGTAEDPFLAGLNEAWLSSLDANLHAVATAEFERRLLDYALRRVDSNQVHAAQLLGISRSMLRSRLQRYKRADQDAS